MLEAATEALPLITRDGTVHELRAVLTSGTDVQVWAAAWAKALRLCKDVAEVRHLRALNGSELASVFKRHPEAVRQVERSIDRRIAELEGAA
ncbi:hypothetical protein [Roseomonas elaeocarpi]|uniref:Uncharacterized protein n=1 Tax=Roseomonas elaeocarpi TaxID=907779 RepID=A0ABV6JT11_9PROT